MSTWLIIDDHPAICFAIKAILTPLGDNTIISVSDGISALAQIKEKQPQLIILDIMLNKMDGLQILQHLRQLEIPSKVIIYTSLPAETYAERALRAGACGFFGKDQDINQLATMCQLVLQDYHCFPDFITEKLLTSSTHEINDKKSMLAKLSDRELTVLRYLSNGLSNKEIADRLILSNKTISTYKSRLMEKLQLSKPEDLVNLLDHQDIQEYSHEVQ
ncbi:DNA-binding response regulator [Entomomonas moraniae]|uniref:DNA-binding response regulator n=1 Tax=Entomomonas moraniae TaxID=2213226 RepID=A0A3S9XCH0_9GAMM|nr:response regulator transcription factor [Entomomonas moraniae]AZS50076.1 DNA-binding response regulator [Entomomonas moraniae]